MNREKLTGQIKAFALELGVDLVGVANIERWKHAPQRMRPQGILPNAKSVVVVAIHHPDACVELGGEPTPHNPGPYMAQMTINAKLDYIIFKLAKFMESKGCEILPIPVSNVWRYRGYKDLPTEFAPDISHIHAAVAAGLAEYGISGLALTPEFGPRQRFSAIITTVTLKPTPLYSGPSLCDKCGECVKACPTKALSRELSGKSKVQIEDRAYEYLNKNKWRCAWAEHFDLDLDLPLPDKITEQVILDTMAKQGTRGGEVGSCLRYCMSPHLRYLDSGYTRVFRRRRPLVPRRDNLLSGSRIFTQNVETILARGNIDYIRILSSQQLKSMEINARQFLPDACSAILCGMECFGREEKQLGEDLDRKTYERVYSHMQDVLTSNIGDIMQRRLQFIELDVCRYLESLGYSAVVQTEFPTEKLVLRLITSHGDAEKEPMIRKFVTTLTSAPLVSSSPLKLFFREKEIFKKKPEASLIEELGEYAQKKGADLFGVASIERLASLLPQLKKEIDQEKDYLVAEDVGGLYGAVVPKIIRKTITLKSPEDYLPRAKSIIVVGIHYPDSCMDRAAKPPADALGPYVFAQYTTTQMLGYLALDIVKSLEDQGYKGVYTLDLLGTASIVNNPRRNILDARANRFVAIAAGLGELGKNGVVLTPEYGVRQRFAAIVTDAPLVATELYSGPKLCPEDCIKCIKACPVRALDKDNILSISMGNKDFTYAKMSQLRCDWAKRYGLVGEAGPKYMGSSIDVCPPENITEKDLEDALRQVDPIQKRLVGILEKCLSVCPCRGKH